MSAADANIITRNFIDSILVEERLIDSQTADLSMELFGEKFDTPIMMPAFSHLDYRQEKTGNMEEYAKAAKNMNMVNWIGMSENDVYESFSNVGARTIRIIKPYADKDKILDQIKFAEEHGALAVGMDIDHIFQPSGEYDFVITDQMGRQTMEDMKEYVASTSLPFVVKGVLSVRDAVKCAECGVKGILVSHHHGRMPYAIPPMMVLPDIKKEVGSDMKIFVDCHIDTGVDAFKALALGADAVAVGRAVLPTLYEKGAEGVEEFIKKMNQELAYMMAFTGCTSMDKMDSSVLWINGRHM